MRRTAKPGNGHLDARHLAYYQSVGAGVAAGFYADRPVCKSRVCPEDGQQFAEVWAVKFCRLMAHAARVMPPSNKVAFPRMALVPSRN
jgi:hypothetical protein